MFSWIFKKKKTAPLTATPGPSGAQMAAQAAESARQAKATAQQAAATTWSDRIARAHGDDNALLKLAKEAPSAELKLAAVRALNQEASLKLAEREFRTHDRRVHQLARQRHAELKLQRETIERATQLLQTGTTLLDETVIPVNRLAELDRHWKALSTTCVMPEQQAAYEALSASLTAQLQAQSDHQAAVRRWAAQTRQALVLLQAASAGIVTEGPAADALTEARDTAAQLLASMPTDQSLSALHTELQSALSQANLVNIVPQAAEPDPSAQPLPAQPPEPKPARAKDKPAHIDPEAAAKTQATIDQHLSQAEAALADGQVALAQQHLMALDGLSPMQADQRSRAGAVQAEVARLKGWQQWGGGLARDELVLESEALAQATTAAAEAGQPIPQIKAHADAIDELRQRWRELDRLKAATSQPLWERFDQALKTAHVPVAAHLEQLEAERQANLVARHELLDALDAIPLPEATDWKDTIRALDQFQTAWRKLGPAQYTTPRKAQKPLFDRMTQSLARLENPLQQARQAAQAEREKLIAQAKGVNPEARGGEAIAQVRELQAQWQQQARALPLARTIETTLWTEFKAATDAVFAQREAAFKARDAAFQEGESARIALIERLQALQADAPLHDLKKTLADVDAAWRHAGDVSRANAGGIESRWRDARAKAQALIAEHAQRQWQATCDTLLDKLSLCEARESGDEVDLPTRWATLPNLPPHWEQALAQRSTAATAPPVSPPTDTADATLLQLETMLDLPSPEGQQAARRELKLLAMKAALEGGKATGLAKLGVDQLTAQVLGNAQLNPAQRQRLRQLIQGWRVTGAMSPPR